jgi:hypothetical protein
MKALKALGGKKAEIRDGLPIPTLRPEYVTIKIKAVGMLQSPRLVEDMLD